ncbi:MAG TPA: hypothetical protein VNS32_15575, partial [Flavisolibacter sp.]|nr:hypothetical protein [Flavisolibacter sp.]
PLGQVLDHLFMKLTVYQWNKKTRSGKLNKRGIIMSIDASKHHAKPNPLSFQKKFMELYEKKIFNLFCRYESKAKTVF